MGWQDDAVVDAPTKPWQKDIVVKAGPVPSVEAFRAAAPPGDPAWQRALPAAGGIVGGIAGGVTGGPPGALGGTALGASIGTSAEQLLRAGRGAPVAKAADAEGNTYQTETGAILHEQLQNVAEQSLMEMGGRAVATVGGAALKAISPVARTGAAQAQQTLTARGGSLSAAQAVQSPAVDLIESFARAGAGGKGRFIALDRKNADALQAAKTDLIQTISRAPPDDYAAGALFQDVVSKGDKAHAAAASTLFTNFDKTVGNALVDTKPLSVFANGLSDQLKRIGDVGKSEAGGKLIDQMKNVGNTTTFSDAQVLRSNLLQTVRDLKASGNEGVALRNASIAAKIVDDAMEQSAKSLGGNAYSEFRRINSFYKEGKEAFNNDVITNLAMQNPERVGEVLFRNGNVTEILEAQKTLNMAKRMDPSLNVDAATNNLRAGYLNALLTTKAATNAEGETVAQNLMKELATVKTDRQFAAMFTPAQRDAIDEFSKTALLTLKNKPSNFGILAPLLQATAIGDLALGASGSSVSTKSPVTDVALLASPLLLARVLTSPKAVGILIRGLELGPKAQASPAVMAKLVSGLNEAMKEGD